MNYWPLLLLALAGQACAPSATGNARTVVEPSPPIDPAAIDAAVDSPDRPAADRELDAARRPREMLKFFGIRPGMKLVELFAVSGWYAELESRVVGPTGEVYAQNPPQFIEKYGDKKITERLAGDRSAQRAPLGPVDRCARAAGRTLRRRPGQRRASRLLLAVDERGWRAAPVYDALKPGGFFAIVDHAAPAGTGDAYARDYGGKHRIDEEFVKQKLLAAGFRLEAESQLLRNPDDNRTRGFFEPEMKGKNTDKFALLFRKPQ